MHEYGVFIGRFQPFHNVHYSTVIQCLDNVEHLIIIIGSALQARNVKNPFSCDERIQMIKECLGPDLTKRVTFIGAKDYLYNDNLWVTYVQQQVKELTNNSKDIVLFGHEKDSSSFYLKMFPQWDYFETDYIKNFDATIIRSLYFTHDMIGIQKMVPNSIFKFLQRFENTEEYKNLYDEYKHLKEYKDMWDKAPYPVTFVTVDAILIGLGHVLVVRRKFSPGKGLMALPGGFVGQKEKLIDAAIRELKEETSIKMKSSQLKKLLVDEKVFDHPERSLRGRTITHAFCFNLNNLEFLPDVKGQDDADKSWWLPLNEVYSSEDKFFEDHAHILQYFINKF